MPYAAGLSTALLLSGCGVSVPPAGPATAPLVAPSDSTGVASGGTPTARATTTSVEVDPVVAKIPKAARPNTQAGAEAFAKFYYEQVAKAWMKPDPALLDGLSAESCNTCTAFRETADYMKAHGERYEISPLTVQSVSAISFSPKKTEIAVAGEGSESRVVDKSGRLVRTAPEEGKTTFVATLVFRDHWVVVRSQVEQ